MPHESAPLATPSTSTAGLGRAADHAGARSWSRSAGRVGVAAGLVGVVGGLFKVLYPPSVDESRYSFPFDAFGFTVENLVLAAQHLGVAALVWGVWTSGAAGRSVTARVGALGVGVGWVGFAAVKLYAVTARDEPASSDLAGRVDGFSGIAGTSIGLFCLVLGVAMLRARVWTGWQRFLGLAAGLVVFAGILPAIALGSFTGVRVAIVVWMAVWTALGWTLLRAADDPRR